MIRMTQLLDNNLKTPTKYLQDSTPLLSKPQQLLEKADREGYLFFKNVMPKDKILSLRRQILEILDRRKLLDKRYDLMDGIADIAEINRYTPEQFSIGGNGFPLDLYFEIQKLRAFHAIAHEPRLLDVLRVLFQAEPFVHPKTIARIVMPHRDVAATPPHQDYVYIQGSQQFWTVWFPLGDCPMRLGGLAMLEGSHKAGIYDVSPAKGAGNFESILCGLDHDWVVGDYVAGDVVMFNSHTVHKALPNQIKEHIRLSCDFRYQSIHEAIADFTLVPHVPNSWEEIYADWDEQDPLKYYWQQQDMKHMPWEPEMLRNRPKIC
jgi:hypothetical protein